MEPRLIISLVHKRKVAHVHLERKGDPSRIFPSFSTSTTTLLSSYTIGIMSTERPDYTEIIEGLFIGKYVTFTLLPVESPRVGANWRWRLCLQPRISDDLVWDPRGQVFTRTICLPWIPGNKQLRTVWWSRPKQQPDASTRTTPLHRRTRPWVWSFVASFARCGCIHQRCSRCLLFAKGEWSVQSGAGCSF